jgi:hypothetical protein
MNESERTHHEHPGGSSQAVLGEELRGILNEQHAVVDNPQYGNARYVWRADRGATNKDGEPLNWREVFGNHKLNARSLGAITVRHIGEWEERTLNYLTCSIDELPQV